MLVVIECILVIVAVCMAIAFPRLGNGWFARLEQRFVKFAKHRTRSLILVGLGTVALRVALLPTLPIPEPAANDQEDLTTAWLSGPRYQ